MNASTSKTPCIKIIFNRLLNDYHTSTYIRHLKYAKKLFSNKNFFARLGPSTMYKSLKNKNSRSQTFQHGFPYKPTALAWDPYFRIIAIGTATGAIRIYGRLGVEYSGQHEKSIPVTKIVFVSSQHQMITLCDDNSLHLWRLATTGLTWVKSQIYEVKLKKITTLCLRISEGHLLLGTEGGNVYHMYLDNFTRAPTIIYQEMVKAE
jgi:WD40 repeat protein